MDADGASAAGARRARRTFEGRGGRHAEDCGSGGGNASPGKRTPSGCHNRGAAVPGCAKTGRARRGRSPAPTGERLGDRAPGASEVTVADALLLALGAIAVGFGALVVTSAHLVRAGFYLVASLGAIAGLYLVMGAELVAWVQVLVYVGAVVVLLLFAVMLPRAPIGPSRDLDRPALPAVLIGAGVGIGLAALLADAFRWTEFDLPPPSTAQR